LRRSTELPNVKTRGVEAGRIGLGISLQ